MEIQARDQMERQTQRLNDYPEVKARVIRHLEETKVQLQRLEQCLEGCGRIPVDNQRNGAVLHGKCYGHRKRRSLGR